MATLLLAAAGGALGASIGGSFLGLSGAVLGQAAGSILGTLIDARIATSLAPDVHTQGARLESLRVTTSSEGAVIPRVHGRMRVGGNLIWATDFREEKRTTTQGGGGKGRGGGKVRTTTWSYSASFAVALCEGPIAGVGRIWADGKPFDLAGAVWRLHRGDEDQLPDPLIVAKMGAEGAPAYRGTAHVVFEDLPLERFGNRLPQLSFEVIRPVGEDGAAESLIRAVNLIPGAGEFALSTRTVTRRGAGGVSVPENRNGTTGLTDIEASLDDLERVLPNVEAVSLVVAWFGTDLRAGACQVRPGIEDPAKVTSPLTWSVNGVLRAAAHPVSLEEGRPVYGGTPSDASVVEAIRELRARGKRITFYPFLMMDIPAGNTLPNPYSAGAATPGQPALPWRGRITCAPAAGFAGSVDRTAVAAAQVAAFFGAATLGSFAVTGTSVRWTGPGGDWGYRRMILHYARLCAAAGGVESFLIGSELRGLTTIRSGADSYPAVEALRALAADCRTILGPATKIGYAADWSEWFGHQPQDGSNDVFFHLDPLWADPAIDFIGIDNYLPLSDWRGGSDHLDALAGAAGIHDLAYLQSNVEGGEGHDWFYASEAAREAQVRSPITDGTHGKPWVFRPKDIRSWWSNPHRNRPGGVESASPTSWVPQSKPIRFTEIGCPAVDKGTNQPNLFFDPRSSESALPWFSTGARDDLIQRRYLEALIGYWSDPLKNPTSGLYAGRMIDMSDCAVWCWDARPYPTWPARAEVWGDAANWTLGHWLNGRMGKTGLGSLVAALAARSGIDPGLVDAGRLTEAVPGHAITSLESPRASIEPLARYFGFDAVETGGMLRFVPRGADAPVATITHDDLVAGGGAEAGGEERGEVLGLTRAQETELPRVLKWRLLSEDEAFEAITVEARRSTADTVGILVEQFAIAHPAAEADRNVRRALLETWTGRETGAFVLPPSRLALDPTDAVVLEHDGRRLPFVLTRITDGAVRQIEARRTDAAHYNLAPGPARPPVVTVPVVFGPPEAIFLDLPQLAEEVPAHRPLVAIAATPWYGTAAVWRSAGLDGFELFETVEVPARIGALAEPLGPGPAWRFDHANALLLDIAGESLASVEDLALFAGANALAVEHSGGLWEILQFARAELVAPDRWRLTRLLRGQSGTEEALALPAGIGARVVILDGALKPLPVTEAEIGLPWIWRIGPADRAAGDEANLALDFTPEARGLRPLSPVHLTARWQSGGDIHLGWTRRSRALAADSWAAPEVPLGEALESFDLEILDGTGAVLRTVSGLPSTGFTYTAVLQAADFGAPVASLRFRVFQNGALGRGAPAEATR